MRRGMLKVNKEISSQFTTSKIFKQACRICNHASAGGSEIRNKWWATTCRAFKNNVTFFHSQHKKWATCSGQQLFELRILLLISEDCWN